MLKSGTTTGKLLSRPVWKDSRIEGFSVYESCSIAMGALHLGAVLWIRPAVVMSTSGIISP